jgi:hypothetical protein
MPLSESTSRHEIHRRVIDMHAFARDDGLFDIESRLKDSKPFDFARPSAPNHPVVSGTPLHDLWIRITIDIDCLVHNIEAASDTTPWGICKEAELSLKVLEGERIGPGWSSLVKGRLRGAAGCTHLVEMLIPLATTALQSIMPIRRPVPELASQVDTCYAFGRDREVVQRLWPLLHGRS